MQNAKSTTAAKSIQSSLKPPDLFVVKEDLSLYERKLRRWSRACGIDPKLYLLYCSIFKLSMYVAATVIFPVSTKSLSEPIVGAGGLMPIIDRAWPPPGRGCPSRGGQVGPHTGHWPPGHSPRSAGTLASGHHGASHSRCCVESPPPGGFPEN